MSGGSGGGAAKKAMNEPLPDCLIKKFAKVLKIEEGAATVLITMLSNEAGALNAAASVHRFMDNIKGINKVTTTFRNYDGGAPDNSDVDKSLTYKISDATDPASNIDVTVLAQGEYGLVLQATQDGRIVKREHWGNFAEKAKNEKFYRRFFNEQLIAIYLRCIAKKNSVNITGIYNEYFPGQTPVPWRRGRTAPMGEASAFILPDSRKSDNYALRLHADGCTNSALIYDRSVTTSGVRKVCRRLPDSVIVLYTTMDRCDMTMAEVFDNALMNDSIEAKDIEKILYPYFIKLGALLEKFGNECGFKHNDLHPGNVMTSKNGKQLVIIDCGMASCYIGGKLYITKTPNRDGYDLLILILYIMEYIIRDAIASGNRIAIAKAEKLNTILKWFMTSGDINIFDELKKYCDANGRDVFHQAYPWALGSEAWATTGRAFDAIKVRLEPVNFARIWKKLFENPGDPLVVLGPLSASLDRLPPLDIDAELAEPLPEEDDDDDDGGGLIASPPKRLASLRAPPPSLASPIAPPPTPANIEEGAGAGAEAGGGAAAGAGSATLSSAVRRIDDTVAPASASASGSFASVSGDSASAPAPANYLIPLTDARTKTGKRKGGARTRKNRHHKKLSRKRKHTK